MCGNIDHGRSHTLGCIENCFAFELLTAEAQLNYGASEDSNLKPRFKQRLSFYLILHVGKIRINQIDFNNHIQT